MAKKTRKTSKKARRSATTTSENAPLTPEQLKARLKPRDALKKVPAQPRQLSLILAGTRKIGVKVDSIKQVDASVVSKDAKAFELSLSIEGAAVGVHTFPPSVKTKKLSSSRKLLKVEEGSEVLTGYLPDHLPLLPTPKRLDRSLVVPPRIQAIRDTKKRKGLNEATTVFAPDDRYIFSDTSFPWCTVGRVDTPGGAASGVMVGPRHMLTVSHTIQWNSDGTAGWIKFTPSYFDGSTPFGVAWGQLVYYEVKVFPPGIDAEEGRHDYVVVVLNTRMGDLTGWMGSKTYSDSWDGGNYWSHIGYPADLASVQRPSYQSPIALDGSDSDPQEHQRIFHKGDVWPGQSGGPMFGWWDGEPWPRVVSVQSWQNPNTNGASGGEHMVDLIIRARNEHP